jgi:hypothetical protein
MNRPAMRTAAAAAAWSEDITADRSLDMPVLLDTTN